MIKCVLFVENYICFQTESEGQNYVANVCDVNFVVANLYYDLRRRNTCAIFMQPNLRRRPPCDSLAPASSRKNVLCNRPEALCHDLCSDTCIYSFYLKISMLNVTIFCQYVCRVIWNRMHTFLEIFEYFRVLYLPVKMCR